MKKKFTFLIAALMLLTMISQPTRLFGQEKTETTTTYVFQDKSWKAKIGTTNADWTSGKDGGGFSNNGIQVTTTYTGANGTSPVSFENVTKIVATYNTNKSGGAGTIVAKIGSNSEVSKNWAYSGSGDGRTANYTVQWDYTTPQTGSVKITCNTTTNSIYLVKVAITTSSGSSGETTTTTISDAGITNTNKYVSTEAGSLSATVTYGSPASAVPEASVTWSGDDDDVATINSSSGIVTLVGAGTVTFTATYAGAAGYNSSFDTYEMTVTNEDPSIVTIWSENFVVSGYSSRAETYGYTTTSSSVQTSDNYAGGTAPEMMVGKNGGTFSATIPLLTSSYGYSGDLTLKYKTNAKSLNVKTTTDGLSVEGEESTGTGVTYSTSGEHTITFKGVTTSTVNMTIVFTATSSDNVRLDDIILKGVQEAITKVATPTFSPSSGAVASGTEVTIECLTAGATIHYTTDGSTPTSSSTAYNPSSKPTITAATTIKAIAVKDGLTDSDVASASYTIAEPCATPTFSPEAGLIEKGDEVEISCTTVGATIYYTTDGSTPTTSSTVYYSAITVNTGLTIKAIAVKDGHANSAVASATYTVIDYTTLPFDWNGGTSSALTALTGVTANGLGSDYAVANAPYRIKMDGANDYIQIKTDCQPGYVTIDVKMLGGGDTSKIKIQESADGSSFTDVEELTISGSQNDVLNLATTKAFKEATRYVKIIKSVHGSNIGVGPISILKNKPAPSVNGDNEIESDVAIGDGESLIISSLIKIPSGKKITVSSTGVIVNTDASNLIIEEGGQLIIPNNATVAATFIKNVPEKTSKDVKVTGWKLISSPTTTPGQAYENFDDVNNLEDEDGYLLYKYDEEYRMWRSSQTTNHTYNTLNVGQGYLYGNNSGTAIEFTGNVNSAASYSIDLSYNEKDSDNLAGFNLIGNPFSHEIAWSNGLTLTGGSISNGYYKIDGKGFSASLCTENIAPLQGILVKANATGQSVTFNNVMPGAKGEKANHDNIMFKVENSEYSDVAYALFDKGYGLNKINHRGDMVPMLYIPQNGENYAIAMMDDNTNSFNLNFEAKTTGNYTLRFKANGEFIYLHVIDRLTGEDIDMLVEGEYSFVGSPRDNANRFIVRLGYLPNYSDNGEDIFAYQNGNDIVVSGEGELQIFDVMGRMVATQRISGIVTMNVKSQGVYIFRLNGKTQKIVVR